MGKIYINCSRCGKDLECEELCDVYTSKIDDSFICKDCYKKEKPDYIQQLKQQLDEKDKEINSLIVDYEKRISQEQELMSNMEHRLTEKQKTIDEINREFVQAVHDWKALCAEKDKEIEKLKQQYTILENENGKLTTELIMDKYKKAQKEVSFGKQLAIQELEKVKEWLEPKYFDYEQINYLSKIIDQQIKKLKGE